MKNIYGIVGFVMMLMACRCSVCAQSEAVSPRLSFYITSTKELPNLEFVDEVVFVDEDGNNAESIDANGAYKIVVRVKNSGRGVARRLKAKISAEGTTNGILVQGDMKLPDISAGDTATVEYPIKTDMETDDGIAKFVISVEEPNGMGTDTLPIVLSTSKFREPWVVVHEYKVQTESGILQRKESFRLSVMILNKGEGHAENLRVKLNLPESIVFVEGDTTRSVGRLAAGDTIILECEMMANQRYEKPMIPLMVNISEKFGEYAQDSIITLELSQPAPQLVKFESKPKIEPINMGNYSFFSDVDKDIPQVDTSYPNRYALIIGNERYIDEVPAPYAKADAKSFKEYCIKTLGVPKRQIFYVEDATCAQMKDFSDIIKNKAENRQKHFGDAEIVFYYAGHGLPDPNRENTPCLIPTDVRPVENMNNAIPLFELCKTLAKTEATKVTVFLDACFMGGNQNNSFLAATRGMIVTPKKDNLFGSTVVFFATNISQYASPYEEKGHGRFTYFLLKKLQESKGACTYKDLFDYLDYNVKDISYSTQTPTILFSPGAEEDHWENWTFQDN